MVNSSYPHNPVSNSQCCSTNNEKKILVETKQDLEIFDIAQKNFPHLNEKNLDINITAILLNDNLTEIEDLSDTFSSEFNDSTDNNIVIRNEDLSNELDGLSLSSNVTDEEEVLSNEFLTQFNETEIKSLQKEYEIIKNKIINNEHNIKNVDADKNEINKKIGKENNKLLKLQSNKTIIKNELINIENADNKFVRSLNKLTTQQQKIANEIKSYRFANSKTGQLEQADLNDSQFQEKIRNAKIFIMKNGDFVPATKKEKEKLLRLVDKYVVLQVRINHLKQQQEKPAAKEEKREHVHVATEHPHILLSPRPPTEASKIKKEIGLLSDNKDKEILNSIKRANITLAIMKKNKIKIEREKLERQREIIKQEEDQFWELKDLINDEQIQEGRAIVSQKHQDLKQVQLNLERLSNLTKDPNMNKILYEKIFPTLNKDPTFLTKFSQGEVELIEIMDPVRRVLLNPPGSDHLTNQEKILIAKLGRFLRLLSTSPPG